MIIRDSRPHDRERLFEIWRDAVARTHSFLKPGDFEEIGRQVRESYLPHAQLLVAEDGMGRLVGFMGMTDAHIDSLFIDPEHHGNGVGSALVARASEAHAVLTVDVNEQNEKATGFYERLGFICFGRSAEDDAGRPYPLLHLRRTGPAAD